MASDGKTNSLPHTTKWAYDDKEIEGAVPVPGIGLMYAGLRSWVIVGWDGKPVKSGPLRRTDIGGIGDSLGHGRLAVRYKGKPAVLSTDNRLLITGVQCHPSPAGRFLIGESGRGW